MNSIENNIEKFISDLKDEYHNKLGIFNLKKNKLVVEYHKETDLEKKEYINTDIKYINDYLRSFEQKIEKYISNLYLHNITFLSLPALKNQTNITIENAILNKGDFIIIKDKLTGNSEINEIINDKLQLKNKLKYNYNINTEIIKSYKWNIWLFDCNGCHTKDIHVLSEYFIDTIFNYRIYDYKGLIYSEYKNASNPENICILESYNLFGLCEFLSLQTMILILINQHLKIQDILNYIFLNNFTNNNCSEIPNTCNIIYTQEMFVRYCFELIDKLNLYTKLDESNMFDNIKNLKYSAILKFK